MSIVAKHADFRDSRSSFSAATFRKVLKGFEMGGLPYTEVEFQLKRLLATGVSPGELREVLRRCELIEPLPEYAYRQVAGLLDEAIEQEAAMQPPEGAVDQQEEESDPAKLSAELQLARDALESEHARVREAEEALSERIASEEAARSRLDTTLRESERFQADLRAARTTIASRDNVTAQMRQTLDQRDAELSAARAELEAARAELDAERNKSREIERSLTDSTSLSGAARESLASRDKTLAEVRQTLAERDAQLTSLQREHAETLTSLEAERHKRGEIERSLTNGNSQIGAARELLALRDKALAEVRQRLAERDAQLAALQSEYEQSLFYSNSQIGAVRESLASREKTLAELRKMLADRDAQLAALGQRHTKAMGESEGRNQKAEEKLQAAQKRATAANADLDNLRIQVAGFQAKLRDSNALIEKLGASVRIEAKRAAQWYAKAQQLESKAAQILPRGEVYPTVEVLPPVGVASPTAVVPPVQALPRVDVLPSVEVEPRARSARASAPVLPRFRLNVRGWRLNFRTTPRAIWIGAAIVLVAIWLVAHRPAPAPSAPVVAKAPVIQPGTAIRDCPTCPVLTVLPTGRFEQGSAPTENGSTFEKPLHWVMIAHPIALSTNAVTVDEFREFVAATGRDMHGCETYDGDWRYRAENNWENPGFEQTGSHPVTCTSWNDAKAYAAWLSAKTGHHYRLPSASEWEYAARAGGAAAQPWSAESSDACANANVADQSAAHRYPGWTVFACNDGYAQTAPVGSFKANSFGLNDMLGNVFQWTEDCWNADYKGAPIDGAARTDGNCAERELRGGSWFSSPNYVRANYRNHFGVDYRTSTVGIRLARDIAS
jgi:formylglycine-generating enzyme required for sulfatase activity